MRLSRLPHWLIMRAINLESWFLLPSPYRRWLINQLYRLPGPDYQRPQYARLGDWR